MGKLQLFAKRADPTAASLESGAASAPGTEPASIGCSAPSAKRGFFPFLHDTRIERIAEVHDLELRRIEERQRPKVEAFQVTWNAAAVAVARSTLSHDVGTVAKFIVQFLRVQGYRPRLTVIVDKFGRVAAACSNPIDGRPEIFFTQIAKGTPR